MKIAIVADWLPVFAGAEHVIAEFHALWPEAPIFTSIANRDALGPLANADIRTTPLQRLYKMTKEHRILLPLMPRALENIDLEGFDVILSSSHAVGKGIIPPSTAVHICYCHTPMRYAWEMEGQYLKDFRIPKFATKRIRKKLTELRRWDMTTAARTDVFIANSSETQSRIKTIYNRDSMVILPPIEDRFFEEDLQESKDHFLAIGRMVPYKRFDLVIETANKLKLPLVIAGRGPDEARLKRLAGPTVSFAGFVPSEDLPALYGQAKAVLLPQHEDAGIVPLEAQAMGTPVIAFGKGGALDTVIDRETGVFFKEQSVESLSDALQTFEGVQFDAQSIRNHAEKFKSTLFRKAVSDIVTRSLAHK